MRKKDLINKGLRPQSPQPSFCSFSLVRNKDLINKGLEPFVKSALRHVGVIFVRKVDLMNKGLRLKRMRLFIVKEFERKKDLMNKGF